MRQDYFTGGKDPQDCCPQPTIRQTPRTATVPGHGTPASFFRWETKLIQRLCRQSEGTEQKWANAHPRQSS